MEDQDHQARLAIAEEKDTLVLEQERQYDSLMEKLSSVPVNNDGENVECIVFMLHGIGSTPLMLSKDYRMIKYLINSIKQYWFYKQRFKVHVHLLDWKRHIIDAQNMLFDHTYITTSKEVRKMITGHMLDIGFYLNPKYSDFLLECVVQELDGEIMRLRNHPSGKFKDSKVAIIGYSMGSLLLHEILCGNPGRQSNLKLEDRPRLRSKVNYMFTVGSPLSCFMVFQSPQMMKTGMLLPEGVEAYNVFHPYDPIAFRWERLIYREVKDLPEPEVLPFWQNNGYKNWYCWERSVQQAKNLIVDNISDIASSVSKSIFGWWGSNKSNSILVNNVAVHNKRHLALGSFKKKLMEKSAAKTEKVVKAIEYEDPGKRAESQQEKETSDAQEETSSETLDQGGKHDSKDEKLEESDNLAKQSHNALHDMNKQSGGHLPKRYDFQLQEDITEHFLSPLGIIQSHTNYWSSKDLMFFILKKLVKKHEPISITAYFNSIKVEAKRMADIAANNQLKAKFLSLAEEASSRSDKFTSEDNKAKMEASVAVNSTWTNLMKGKDEHYDDTDVICSDPVD